MRRSGVWRMGPAVVLTMGAGLGSIGCTSPCDLDFTCPPFDITPVMPVAARCPDDPADALAEGVPDACGIWVSVSLGDDQNGGSQKAPVATLTHAIAKAIVGPRRIYACAETFDESIELPAGVSLHGGFFCEDLDWRYAAGGAPTKLTTEADHIPLTLTDSVIAEPALITDFEITAENAKEPGGSSIAVLARSGARAVLRRDRLWAGDGADGADGDAKDHFGVPAKDGVHGVNGAAACTADVGIGGALVALDCGEDSSFGGQGGDGGQLVANGGDDGEVAPASNPQGFGIGGDGEDLANGLFCTPGIGGAAGQDGEPGLGGAWPPRLTEQGYLGVWGQDGKRGRSGQGGGGGGASAGNALCAGSLFGGAGGGSGGTGGCGGKGGRGGQPGGSSIGFATLSDQIKLDGVEITARNGGDGGRGGDPQQGGQGGLPGIGGPGFPVAGGPSPGCFGGGGGYGGDGGHAGGGLGGSSLPIARLGGVEIQILGGTRKVGEAGKGGLGSNSSSATQGEDGRAAELESLLP